MSPVYGMGDCLDMHGDVDSFPRPNPTRPCTRCGMPIGPRKYRWCSVECGRWFGDNHNFRRAREHVLKAAAVKGGYLCAFCESVVARVEVDHIEAALGRHGKSNCIHHVANLRALCVPCHKDRTRAQRATAVTPQPVPSSPALPVGEGAG